VKSAWRLLASHRDYRLLLISGLVSLTGDWILTIGLTYSVYRITGSTLASGTMLLAVFLPQVALGSLAGVFVDRWDRRSTMVAADLLMAAGLLPIVLVHTPGQVWIIYLVAFWEGGVEQFFTPAQAATVPRLVDADELTAANGAYGQIQNVARLLGSATGGVVAAYGGLTGVAIGDAASFVLSAGLLARLQVRHERPPQPSRETSGALPTWQEWAAGLRISWQDPVLRLLAVFMAVSSIGEGVMLTLMAPFVIRVLHGDASSYGAILALQAVGGIAGGLLIAAYGRRLSTRLLVGIGSVLFGALDLMLFLYPLITPWLWPAGLLIALAGLPGAGIIAGYTTALQVRAGDDHRGRVFGTFATVSAAAILLGIIGGGALGGVLGIIPVIAAQGGGYCLVGLYLTATLRGRGGSTALSVGPANLSGQRL
jgi:Na+/melibiose symporter-like transporter